MLDRPTAQRNLVLALRLAIFSALMFAGALIVGVLVRYA